MAPQHPPQTPALHPGPPRGSANSSCPLRPTPPPCETVPMLGAPSLPSDSKPGPAAPSTQTRLRALWSRLVPSQGAQGSPELRPGHSHTSVCSPCERDPKVGGLCLLRKDLGPSTSGTQRQTGALQPLPPASPQRKEGVSPGAGGRDRGEGPEDKGSLVAPTAELTPPWPGPSLTWLARC